jgi:hypothetical protein
VGTLIADLESAFEEVLAALAENRNGILEKYTQLAPPIVCWEPTLDDVPIAVHRECLTRWHLLRGTRQLPDWGDFRTEEFGAVVTRSTVVDPIPGTTDLRYRIYGSRVAENEGRDWEGATLGDVARVRRSLGPLLIRAVYILARERRVPVYTWHARATRSHFDGWHRLVLPFAAPAPYEVRFMSAIEVEGAEVDAPAVTRTMGSWPGHAVPPGPWQGIAATHK